MRGTIGILFAFSVYLVVAEVCPGGQQTCAAGMTCCELPSGQQGCCPYKNATCCSDKVHCCPDGYDCLTSSCRKRDEDTFKELKRLLVDDNSQNVNASANSIVCPDFTQCGDDDTCCSVGEGHYGCCPMPEAVCCSDLRTCCPQGYTCNGQGGCEREDKIVRHVQISPKTVVCPGGRYKCPGRNTCCPTQGGRYACCPLYHAVCCQDGRHCCPYGYTCDSSTGECNKN